MIIDGLIIYVGWKMNTLAQGFVFTSVGVLKGFWMAKTDHNMKEQTVGQSPGRVRGNETA